jgi:hypothetical protein
VRERDDGDVQVEDVAGLPRRVSRRWLWPPLLVVSGAAIVGLLQPPHAAETAVPAGSPTLGAPTGPQHLGPTPDDGVAAPSPVDDAGVFTSGPADVHHFSPAQAVPDHRPPEDRPAPADSSTFLTSTENEEQESFEARKDYGF